MFHKDLRFMKRRGFGFGHGDDSFGGPPFGEGPFGRGGHGRFRQRRGDIKFVLLDLLKDKPYHGYELIKAIEERSGGFYRPSAGAIYPTLQLLEDEGSVTSEVVNDKRVYTITDAGRKLLQERESSEGGFGFGPFGRHQHRPDSPQLGELRRAGMELVESVMQAARYGTPEQIQAVKATIESASKQVHAILAQPGSDKV